MTDSVCINRHALYPWSLFSEKVKPMTFYDWPSCCVFVSNWVGWVGCVGLFLRSSKKNKRKRRRRPPYNKRRPKRDLHATHIGTHYPRYPPLLSPYSINIGKFGCELRCLCHFGPKWVGWVGWVGLFLVVSCYTGVFFFFFFYFF